MRGKAFLVICISLLVLSSLPPSFSQQQGQMPEISVVNPFNETNNFIFASDTVVGYRFNATIYVYNAANVSSWQVNMNYNGSFLNATKRIIPTNDPQYIFYLRTTFAPNETNFSSGTFKIGAITTPLFAVYSTTPKKLAIIEFQILAKPPSGIGNNVSSILNINNADTYLLNPIPAEVPTIKTDGYYQLNNKDASQISMILSPTSLYVNGNVTITGTISTVPANPSAEFQNEPVTILHRLGGIGDFTNLTDVVTNVTSQFSYTLAKPVYGAHQFESLWNGNSTYEGSYSGIFTVVVNRLNSSITLYATPTSVTAGDNVTINGSVSPPRAGVTIAISAAQNTIATVTTTAGGTFSYAWTTGNSGTFQLTATSAGDATYDASTSNTVQVSVASAPIPWYYYVLAFVVIIIIAIIIIRYLGRR